MKNLAHSLLSGLLSIALIAGADKCNRPPEDGVECSFVVAAKDYTGLDGCGILLEGTGGVKLLAINLADFASNVAAGDSLRISYEEVPNMVSICMAEKRIVRLTCAEWISKATGCPEIIDPYRIAWSGRVMQEIDPRQVEVLYLEADKAYRFTGQSEIRIYTCTGELLCSYPVRDSERCQDILSRVRDPKIIYIVNE